MAFARAGRNKIGVGLAVNRYRSLSFHFFPGLTGPRAGYDARSCPQCFHGTKRVCPPSRGTPARGEGTQVGDGAATGTHAAPAARLLRGNVRACTLHTPRPSAVHAPRKRAQ
jgi:hypothetical protein